MFEHSARQVGALTITALAAPLLMVSAAVSWVWVLAALVAAALYYIYIVWASGRLAPHVGFAAMLTEGFGAGGKAILGLYWLWLILSAARAGRLSAAVFPVGQSFPAIPIVLALLAAWVGGKGVSAVCRFGSLLFFLVLPLLGLILCFALPDLELRNLRPSGDWRGGLSLLAVLLLPTMGLFLRGSTTGRSRGSRWFALAALLAMGCAVAVGGVLGPALTAREQQPFFYLTQSISILGVMERFESVTSSLLLTSFACLLAYFYSMCGKILTHLFCQTPKWVASWVPAAASVGLLWVVPYLPNWVWLTGDTLFWGLIPAVTLGVVWRARSGGVEKC